MCVPSGLTWLIAVLSACDVAMSIKVWLPVRFAETNRTWSRTIPNQREGEASWVVISYLQVHHVINDNLKSDIA